MNVSWAGGARAYLRSRLPLAVLRTYVTAGSMYEQLPACGLHQPGGGHGAARQCVQRTVGSGQAAMVVAGGGRRDGPAQPSQFARWPVAGRSVRCRSVLGGDGDGCMLISTCSVCGWDSAAAPRRPWNLEALGGPPRPELCARTCGGGTWAVDWPWVQTAMCYGGVGCAQGWEAAARPPHTAPFEAFYFYIF